MTTEKKEKIRARIARRGYIIEKKSLTDKTLCSIKEDLFITPTVPEEFSVGIKSYPIYYENEETITVPKFYGIKKFGRVKMKNIEPENNTFKFTGKLREEQMEIVDDVLPKIIGKGGGIISLPCGAGKTVIALYLAHELKVKTLVLVHKTFLQDQWINRASAFTDAKIGSIRQSIVDTDGKDIVIGMIQSISMRHYDAQIFDKFGLVIVDECHHIASRVFSRALYKICTRYTIGLSATPERKDGLTKIIHWYLGKTLYIQERKKQHNVVVRRFRLSLDDPLFKEKTVWTNGKIVPCIPRMITNLTKIMYRTKIIINIINTLRRDPKRKILILSGRIDHLDYMKQRIDKKISLERESGKILDDECRTYYYIGRSKPIERKEAEQNGDILFASYEMAHEGLDIDRLNTIILATPKKDVIQAIGRIMRKISTDSDVKPLIIDIADDFSVFYAQSMTRYKLYKKNNYLIKDYKVNDNYVVSLKNFMKHKEILEDDHISMENIFDDVNMTKCDEYFETKSTNVIDHDAFDTCLF